MYGVVKGACEGLGVNTLLRDLGESDPKVRMHVDATAAKGVIERKGIGKLRHIELDILWLQEQEARKLLPLNKVLGTDNIADLMTKNLTAAVIDRYVGMMGMRFAEGRSKIAQELHSVERIDLNPPATPESQSMLLVLHIFSPGKQSGRASAAETDGQLQVSRECGSVSTSKQGAHCSHQCGLPKGRRVTHISSGFGRQRVSTSRH